MMFYAIPIGLLVGWIRGGSMDALTSYQFRRSELVLFAFAIQGLLSGLAGRGVLIPDPYAFGILLLSYVLLSGALLINLGSPGVPLVTSGTLANWLVITLNGGMPVDVDRLRSLGYEASARLLESGGSPTHVALDETTRFPLLGDVILGPTWLPVTSLMSPGDLLMMGGIAWIIAAGMAAGRGG